MLTLISGVSNDNSVPSDPEVRHDTCQSSNSPCQSSTLSEAGVEGQTLCLHNHERDPPAPLTRKRKLKSFGPDSLHSFPAKKISSRLDRDLQSRNLEEDLDRTTGAIWRQNTELEEECQRLKQRLYQAQRPTIKVLHRVYCSDRDQSAITTDIPSQFGSSSHLQGQEVIPDLDIFIAERKSNLIFVVFKNYTCCMGEEHEHGEGDTFCTENDSVSVISPKFSQYMNELTGSLTKPNHFFPYFKTGSEFLAPFYWYYECITELKAQVRELAGEAREYIGFFQRYVERDFHQLYESVAAQLKGKTITWETLPFLYSPGTVLVWQEGNVEKTGALVHWPEVIGSKIEFQMWNWLFDGHFCRDRFSHDFDLKKFSPTEHDEDELISISDLPCYPIQFAEADFRQRRRKAGHAFWRCRQRRFVTYNGWDFRHDEWNVSTTNWLRRLL